MFISKANYTYYDNGSSFLENILCLTECIHVVFPVNDDYYREEPSNHNWWFRHTEVEDDKETERVESKDHTKEH